MRVLFEDAVILWEDAPVLRVEAIEVLDLLTLLSTDLDAGHQLLHQRGALPLIQHQQVEGIEHLGGLPQ